MSWFWKTDNGWKAYSEDENEKIEAAHSKGQKSFKLNDTYKIDFGSMIQFRTDDPGRQRDVKREGNEKGDAEKKGVKRSKDENEEDEGKAKKKGPVEIKQGFANKRLAHDYKITKDAEAKGELSFSVELIDDDLYKWEIKLFEFDKDSQFAKQLEQYNKKHGVNYVTLRFYFPGDYPLKAPLVHIVTPKLVGSYIFGGGLCMSILMQGWAPGIVPESLVLQTRQLLMEGGVRINNVNKVESYSEKEARDGFKMAQSAHAQDKSFE